MSSKTTTWVETQKVHPAAADLMRELADGADDAGACGVRDITALAGKCGYSVRTAHRALKFLKSTGRLVVVRRSCDLGIQTQSSFELNIDRPGDQEFELPNRSITKAEGPCDRPAGMAERISSRPAKEPGGASDGTARVAERASAGHARLAQRLRRPPYRKAVDLNYKEQQQNRPFPADIMPAREASLVMLLHDQMGLSYSQVADLRAEYSDEHLRLVRDYVWDRAQKGKIQDGKLAPYFLAVARKATPESLLTKPSTADLSAKVPARRERETAAEAAEVAKHEASRLELLKIHDAWIALDPLEQETLQERFLTELGEGNPIVYSSLRRRSGKLADEIRHRMLMNWLIDDAQLGGGVTAIAAGRRSG